MKNFEHLATRAVNYTAGMTALVLGIFVLFHGYDTLPGDDVFDKMRGFNFGRGAFDDLAYDGDTTSTIDGDTVTVVASRPVQAARDTIAGVTQMLAGSAMASIGGGAVRRAVR